MTFHHDPLPPTEIRDETGPDGRFYNTPEGRFPSVTTVIGWSKDKTSLERWRKAVGSEEADGITRQACRRGNAVHGLAEAYLKNDPDWAKDAMPGHLMTFQHMRKVLDRSVGTVRAVEYPLYSRVLRSAGRTDLIAEFDGTLSIIDFKTSRGVKNEERCFGYFVQKAAYAIMLYERLGIRVDQIVTIMSVNHHDPILFVKRRSDYDQHVRDIFIANRTDG